MKAPGDLPARTTTTTTTGVSALARRVIAAFATGDQITNADIALMKELRPPTESSESSESDESETEPGNKPIAAYLTPVPEAARGLFTCMLDEVGDAEEDASADDIREKIGNSAFYHLVDRRTPEPDSAHTFGSPGWSSYDLYLILTGDGPGTRLREGVPSDTIPSALTPKNGDESLAEAASLAELGDTTGLPRVTRHRLATGPGWYGGATLVEDVSQGRQLGDCYLLALFAAVARHDPGVLRRILPPQTFDHLSGILNRPTFNYLRDHWEEEDKDCALVYLWRNLGSEREPFYVPQVFQVSQSLAHNTGGLVGARVRVELQSEKWTLRRQGAQRYVECVMEYRAVTWPALLEKAFAAYLENFGTSGTGPESPGRGYQILGDGSRLGQAFFRTLYGPQILKEERVRLEPLCKYVSGEETSDEMEAVFQAFQGLLKIHTQTQRSQPGTSAVLMTASAGDLHVVMRLQALLVKHRVSLKSTAALGDALTAVSEAETLGLPVQGQEHLTVNAPKISDEELEKLQKAAMEALHKVAKGALGEVEEELAKPAPAAHLSLLHDLLLTLCSPDAPDGGDTTPRRLLYTQHSYALLDAHLVFTGSGAPDPDDIEALPALLARLDAARSTVTLYNPHGQNSANADGPVQGDTGRFTLALNRFLNVAHRINYTTVIRK
jgi:hypothetical protein